MCAHEVLVFRGCWIKGRQAVALCEIVIVIILAPKLVVSELLPLQPLSRRRQEDQSPPSEVK